MKPGFVAIVLELGAISGARAEPYGCWAIKDSVERLACFDEALGPPAATVANPPAPDRSAAPCGGAAEDGCGGPAPAASER